MAYGRDRGPKDLNWSEDPKWIEELAQSEIHMEESGTVDLGEPLDQKQLIEESAVELLSEMKDLFSVYLESFNRLRSTHQGPETVKIYNISGTIADFMLFRNGLKLIVTHRELGVIRLSLNQTPRAALGMNQNSQDLSGASADEILAQVGPFREILWTYQGQPVKTEFLVRFYLSEFIKQSAR
jgi:hypothetical protein